MSFSRRSFLKTVGGGVAVSSLAGCVGAGSSDPNNYTGYTNIEVETSSPDKVVRVYGAMWNSRSSNMPERIKYRVDLLENDRGMKSKTKTQDVDEEGSDEIPYSVLFKLPDGVSIADLSAELTALTVWEGGVRYTPSDKE